MATVVTVLRSGGDFRSWHVQQMARQIRQWAPRGTEFMCLSDMAINGVQTIPLHYNWPGWWSKMELFRPDIKGDFLFTDLDNLVVGPVDDMFGGRYPILQRGGWTALMWLPESWRADVYRQFRSDPEVHMWRFAKHRVPEQTGVGNYGDAGFISNALAYNVAYWEDVLPGQALNLVELRRDTAMGPRHDKSMPEGTRILLCGQPHRPWTMTRFKKYYEESI